MSETMERTLAERLRKRAEMMNRYGFQGSGDLLDKAAAALDAAREREGRYRAALLDTDSLSNPTMPYWWRRKHDALMTEVRALSEEVDGNE